MRKCKAEGGVDSEAPQETTNVNIPATFNLTNIEKNLIPIIPQETINSFETEQNNNEGSEIGISRSMDLQTAKNKADTSARKKLSSKYSSELIGSSNLKGETVQNPSDKSYTHIILLSKPTNA